MSEIVVARRGRVRARAGYAVDETGTSYVRWELTRGERLLAVRNTTAEHIPTAEDLSEWIGEHEDAAQA